MTQLGVAVVGAGVVGRMRAAAAARHPRLRLVAVADLDESRARAAVAGTSAEAMVDPRRVLDRNDVDAVIVATPGHEHEPVAVDALKSGRHVLCEKPLAPDLQACRRIVAAAAAAKRTLAVGFNHRYYPCVKRLKDAIDGGAIGTVDHVRALAGHPGLHEFRAEWMYRRPMSGGGAMMDVGIHMTDLVRFAVGEIAQVVGVCSERVWNVAGSEDNALAIMTTASGTPIRYQATWSEWKGYRLALEVYGSRGMAGAYYAPMMNLVVTTDEARRRRVRRVDLHPWINIREKLRGWETTATLAFAEELTDFVRLIAGEPSRIADGRAGLLAVSVANAVYESSATGRSVTIADAGP